MRSDIQASLDAIKAPALAIVTKVDNIPAAVEAGELAAYNEGVEAGKAMIQLPEPTNPDNIYTQQQMNDAVNAGKDEVRSAEVAPLQLQLTEKQSAIDSLNAQITDLNTKLMAAGPDAVTAFKAELKAKYAEQQVAESTSETGFASLLE